MSAVRSGVLYDEHVLLGAEFEDGCHNLCAVRSYPSEAPLGVAAGEGAVLCDLTGLAYELVSGASSSSLLHAVTCSPDPQVGSAAFECVLTGDGALVSVPLVMRTGDSECALLDFGLRGEVLSGWLGFVRGIEQNGEAPFADTSVEPAADMLVPLLLAGGSARSVLLDYLESPAQLPAPGAVASVRLDAIPALVCHLPQVGSLPESYVLLVPPAYARVLWRSLLSFTEVAPVGHVAVRGLFSSALPWGDAVSSQDLVPLTLGELEAWGVLRPELDFIGARSLMNAQP